MYPEIAKEVEKGVQPSLNSLSFKLNSKLFLFWFSGDLLLEWDASKGVAPAPVLKDKYSMERRRAKTLNFSIAYDYFILFFCILLKRKLFL